MTATTSIFVDDLLVTNPDILEGLNITWVSNTTLTISSGWGRNSNASFVIYNLANITLNSAVTGLNGIDTSTTAVSTCYAVHLVNDSTGFNLPGAIMSLSATAPTMPKGYDIFRRIGWAFTDGSGYFVKIYQVGTKDLIKYVYDDPINLISAGTQTSFTAVDLTGLVPPVNNLPMRTRVYFTPTSGAQPQTAYLRAGGTSATNGKVINSQIASVARIQHVELLSKLVVGVPKVEYKVSAGTLTTLKLTSFLDAR